jgi:hypothetical protein
MPPVQTRKSDPRQAIAERVQRNLRLDPRALVVREMAAAMRPSKPKTTNRAESSKGKRT